MAFWLAVRDRFEEAGNSLKLAGPVPEVRVPWNLSNDRNVGLMDTVIVRIHRGTGRDEEAGHLAAEALARLRPPNDLGDEPCPPSLWETGLVAYASLAANEGQKEEAVRALRLAMHCGDLPFGFWPQLPWFQGLAGYAPYDELVQERERRIRQIRAELIALEEGGGVPGPTAE